MLLTPLGDAAVTLLLGDTVDDAMLTRVRGVAEALRLRRLAGVVDVLPAFASVTVYYDICGVHDFEAWCRSVIAVAREADAGSAIADREVVIPVAYGGEYGPDLDLVAKHARRTVSEVIALHTQARYRVHAMGFVPGFGYLGGLPEALQMPRRSSPRLQVAAGSVALGGGRTAVYPLATPGGWHVIGWTPLRLFDSTQAAPALLRMGDTVLFRELAASDIAQSAAPPRPEEAEPRRAVNADTERDPGDSPGVVVVHPGMLTTVQDLGRRALRADGVPGSGAADSFALRLANLLVGNQAGAAALEVTLRGPELRFEDDVLVALAGAEFTGFPSHRPVRISAGTTLRLGDARKGCRGCLAVAGGVRVPPVLGSRSTYLRGAFGGLGGRALRAGDVLPLTAIRRTVREHWRLDERILPPYGGNVVVRVVRGAQSDEFPPDFFRSGQVYRVTPQCDRMGVRLAGPPLRRDSERELGSMPVVPGTIQVPPDGQPILLLADAQTLGGYPQAAHVISVDLPLVAQLRPGDAVRFAEVSLSEAHQLAWARERAIALLGQGLAQKFT